MSMMRGGGDGSPPDNGKDPFQSQRGRDALMAFQLESEGDIGKRFLNSHKDTEDLRYIAERYRRRKKKSLENTVEFEMDPASGMIMVRIKDEITGELQLRLSPGEVERILKGLEETEDNESTLASFFIDMEV